MQARKPLYTFNDGVAYVYERNQDDATMGQTPFLPAGGKRQHIFIFKN